MNNLSKISTETRNMTFSSVAWGKYRNIALIKNFDEKKKALLKFCEEELKECGSDSKDVLLEKLSMRSMVCFYLNDLEKNSLSR